jgi:hypothetical protein
MRGSLQAKMIRQEYLAVGTALPSKISPIGFWPDPGRNHASSAAPHRRCSPVGLRMPGVDGQAPSTPTPFPLESPTKVA